MSLFDVNRGGNIFFSIMPNDIYVPNTLELLDKNEYMYRVLRAEGFDRVLYFDVKALEVEVIAYDKLSELSFKFGEKFSRVQNWRDEEVLRDFYAEVEGNSNSKPTSNADLFATSSKNKPDTQTKEADKKTIEVKENGWRRRKLYSVNKETKGLNAEFISHLKTALDNNNIRTAVIFDYQVFRAAGDVMLDSVLDFADQYNDNIIVFSFPDAQRFRQYVSNGFFRELISPECEKTPLETLAAEKRLIKVNNQVCADEIANYILYEKVVVGNKKLKDLPFSKIYPLAELIGKSIDPYATTQFLRSVPIAKKITYMRRLADLFDDELFVDEIMEKSLSLKSVAVDFVSNVGIYVNRIAEKEVSYSVKASEADVAIEKLDRFQGEEMKSIKEQLLREIRFFERRHQEMRDRIERGETVSDDAYPYMNMLFCGGPGTGKTTLAKVVADILCAKGFLPSNKVSTYNCSNAVTSGVVGRTAQALQKAAEDAIGGVLILDELSALDQAYGHGDNTGKEAMDMIVSIVNDHKTDLCIILSGYENNVKKILSFNEGGARRFRIKVDFPDYAMDTLWTIFQKKLADKKMGLGEGVEEKIKLIIDAEKASKQQNFGNAGYIDNVMDALESAFYARETEERVFTMEDVKVAFPEYRAIIEQSNAEADEILAELDEYIGDEMASIKEQLLVSIDYLTEKRAESNEKKKAGEKLSDDDFPWMNMRFKGAPGTGKSKIADLTARLLCAKGILPTSKVTEINCADALSSFVAGVKEFIEDAFKEAVGGVLVLDELAALNENSGEHRDLNNRMGKQAMNTIVSQINKYRDSICVILAGYENELKAVVKLDPGADRRFPIEVEFKNYSVETLMSILDNKMDKNRRTYSEGVRDKIALVVDAEKSLKGEHFGNAGFINNLFADLDKYYRSRKVSDGVFTMEDLIKACPAHKAAIESSENDVNSILAELDELVGAEMESVKKELLKEINYLEYRRNRFNQQKLAGKAVNDDKFPYMNMCFFGGPGTGKTTIAEIVARLLCAKGILKKSVVKTFNCSKAINSRSGGSAEVLRAAISDALGGVIILDEIAALDQPHSAGNAGTESMAAIVGEINEHRDDICIILSGYEDKVRKALSFDSGAERRFPIPLHFKDYSVESLMLILDKIMEREEKKFGEGAREKAEAIIMAEKEKLGKNFGNAGFIDNFFTNLDANYFARRATDGVITLEDVNEAYPAYAALNAEALNAKKNGPAKYQKLAASTFTAIKAPYETTEHTEQELYRLTDSAIMFIKTDKGSGTGFLISPDGYVLTCNHVIEDAKEITARLRIKGRLGGDDSFHKCSVVNAKKDCDIALLKLEEGANFPYLPLAALDRAIEKGEEFVLSGYPFGTKDDMTSFAGKVASGDGQTEGNAKCYFINSEAKRGNSGSPIIARTDGRVIGILGGSVTRGGNGLTEEINYMRPIELFWNFFTK